VTIDVGDKSISQNIKRFIYSESYEGEEVKVLKQCLELDDVVMEVGAGLGFLSTYCAQRIGEDKVFAYEVNPEMINVIRRTYFLNNVSPSIDNSLLSNEEGETNFFVESSFWSSSTIKRNESSKKISVPTKNVNSEIARINPSMLIIDIEGGEKDLVPIIDYSNVRKIILEVHPHVIGNHEVHKIVLKLIESGFMIKAGLSTDAVLFFEKVVAA
jgi:FkbM family methyltransferase